MGKRAEYRRMMRALRDLDRVDAGKAPKRQLRPEVRSATHLWVHGRTEKVDAAYAAGVREPAGPRRRWPWLVVLVVAVALIAAMLIKPDWLGNAMRADRTRLLPAVEVTTHGPYAFSRLTGPLENEPTTYDPCRTISYTINPDLAPAGTSGIVEESVAEISRLTGLKFQYVGSTHQPVKYESTMSAKDLVEYPPVEIAWSTPTEFAKFNGDVVGFGGSTSLTKPDGVARYVTGSVSLRADELARTLHGPDGRNRVKSVVLHELGHVVGLGHVQDTHEIMNPVETNLTDFGPGDREGLALLGHGSCD